jgi:hypothetical protein
MAIGDWREWQLAIGYWQEGAIGDWQEWRLAIGSWQEVHAGLVVW